MTPDRWLKLAEVFETALETPRHERSAYLETVGGDEAFRGEILQLLEDFDRSEGFFESALLPNRDTFQTGELLDGRYRIESQLGRGGMGDVFCAFDQVLNVRVALKALHTQGMNSPDASQRFLTEVQLARTITHPNVCRVFDIGTHKTSPEPIPFLTMELLDGETLAARIGKQGRLSPARARPLVEQIAAGLDAAHAKGVVHRDLKSSNIILCGNRAVITDFGLARLNPPTTSPLDESSTLDRNIVGTAAYMSPEQLSGQTITIASDIYTLGILMFEMVTGQLPFDEHHLLHSAMQRAAGDAPSARQLAPDLDQRWDDAIARCLKRVPEQRWRSAGEAAAHLDGSGMAFRPPRYWSRRQWIQAGATATISGAAVTLPWIVSRLRYQEIDSGARLMMTPTLNATGEPRFDGAHAVIRSDLAQTTRFTLWDERRLNEVLLSMKHAPDDVMQGASWREVGLREGVAAVLFSTFAKVGDGYAITFRMEQLGESPQQPVRTWEKTWSASGENTVFEAAHEGVQWLRETAGESLREISAHNLTPERITSSDWSAVQAYGQGVQLARSKQPEEAELMFRRAIQIDPHFALALMRLGDLLVARREDRDGFEMWRRAIHEGRAQRLSKIESFTLESRYAYEIGDFKNAEAVLTAWKAEYRNDSTPYGFLIPTLSAQGRYGDAVAAAREEADRFGSSLFSNGQQIHALGMMNRFEEIDRMIRVLHDLDTVLATRFAGAVAACRGDFAQAHKLLTDYAAKAKGVETSRASSFLANLLAEQGKYAEASNVLRNAANEDRHTGQRSLAAAKTSARGFLEYLLGNRKEAAAMALDAVALHESPEIVMQAVTLLARLGQKSAAETTLERMPYGEGPAHEALVLRARGEVLAMSNAASAIPLLEQAANQQEQNRPKEFLTRALQRSGQIERALKYQEEIKALPWLSWTFPETEWPGLRHSMGHSSTLTGAH